MHKRRTQLVVIVNFITAWILGLTFQEIIAGHAKNVHGLQMHEYRELVEKVLRDGSGNPK